MHSCLTAPNIIFLISELCSKMPKIGPMYLKNMYVRHMPVNLGEGGHPVTCIKRVFLFLAFSFIVQFLN